MRFPQATNEVIGRVPNATHEEMLAAVDSCSRAYHSWSETSILARQQVFLRYQLLIKDNIVSYCCTSSTHLFCFFYSFSNQHQTLWLILELFRSRSCSRHLLCLLHMDTYSNTVMDLQLKGLHWDFMAMENLEISGICDS